MYECYLIDVFSRTSILKDSFLTVFSPAGMAVLLKNTTINGILLDSLFEAGSESEEKMEVVKLIKEGISSGAVRPLPSTTFNHQQVEQSFRLVIIIVNNFKFFKVYLSKFLKVPCLLLQIYG